MRKLLLILMTLPCICAGQSLPVYNPQALYEASGGLYDQDSVRELHIHFHNTNYHNILATSFFTNPSFRLPAAVTLNGITQDSVGVRYKGNSTFCLPNDAGVPKVPYNLDMNHWVSGQKLEGYKKLKLANAWLDATFVREMIASEIYQNYLPAAEVNLLKLNVQGNYLGLYVNTESINKQFLEKHFDEKNGTLFKCDNANVFCGVPVGNAYEPSLAWLGSDSLRYYNTYDLKSDHGWGDLLELMSTLHTNPGELESVLNIDRVLWAFAVNTVIGNYDGYNGYYVHNYYLYKTGDGRFQMIPWDLDNSFLNALLGQDINVPIGPQHPTHFDPFHGEGPVLNRPLTRYLYSHPLYRKQYVAHIRTVIGEMDLAAVRSRIGALQQLAFPAASSDPHKLFSMGQFSSNVDQDLAFFPWNGYGFGGIMSTLTVRRNFLLSLPEIAQQPPVIGRVEAQGQVITAEVSQATTVELMATTSSYASGFESFVMTDDGANGDAVANDGIFSAPVPFQGTGQEVKFYIRAQHNGAMMLSPERAEYEYYQYSNPTDIRNPEAVSTVLSLFPNPAQSILEVRGLGSKPVPFQVLAPTGEKVAEGRLSADDPLINVSGLSPGVYVFKSATQSLKFLKTN